MIEVVPFVVHGLVMAVDEGYCHHTRELRRWERIGHPLDSAFYLVCLLWLLMVPPSETALRIFAGLAIANCLFITKDEWEHRELCSAFENWLHALLFILHPLLLLTAGFMWFGGNEMFYPVVGTVAGLSAFFAIYQIVYWNWIRD